MQNKELVGKRIKELRKARKLSQEILAEKLGIEPRQLSKLETGKHYPSYETMTNLLQILDISFEDFQNFEHLEAEFDLRGNIQSIMDRMDNVQLEVVYKFLKSLTN